MLKIDMQKLLGEKDARELKVSLELLIDAILTSFEKQIDINTNTPADYNFELEFDNGNTFYITVLYQNGRVLKDYGYIDFTGENKDLLNLQEALNINKYAKDIEVKLKEFIKKENITIQGSFTMQSIDKKRPIFAENNVKLRNSANDLPQYIKVVNVKVYSLER